MSFSKSKVITHRGLEPSNPSFKYPESSYEAFKDQLSRGFGGLEFDPNFASDGIVVSHDATLKRITNGGDERDFSEVSVEELTKLTYGSDGKSGRIPTFDEVINLIKNSGSNINAMHLKGKNQSTEKLDKLLEALKKYEDILDKFIIFDVKPETARYLKSKMPGLHLAPSVAHSYDIKRYNEAVLGTLISVEEALKYIKEGLYDSVWLDEWDLADENQKTKTLYNEEVFNKFKEVGAKIYLVTPELHGTSPGLLGGEAHQDASSKEKLFSRIKEIINLEPDGICTDYPEEVLEL
ncbi:MAG: glycerophosphodiester phosphodiesterase [Candidatus Nanoarchaeia archaeon]